MDVLMENLNYKLRHLINKNSKKSFTIIKYNVMFLIKKTTVFRNFNCVIPTVCGLIFVNVHKLYFINYTFGFL